MVTNVYCKPVWDSIELADSELNAIGTILSNKTEKCLMWSAILVRFAQNSYTVMLQQIICDGLYKCSCRMLHEYICGLEPHSARCRSTSSTKRPAFNHFAYKHIFRKKGALVRNFNKNNSQEKRKCLSMNLCNWETLLCNYWLFL